MARMQTAWRAALGGAVLLALGWAGPARGQSANVLAVLPEGVVLPAAPFPDLRPGARMGFHRPGGDTTQVGEGWILDVSEGQALVGLKPGSSVRPGDVAILCATLSMGSQGELRETVQALKGQLSAAGGGNAELQATVLQLESALDAREAAIRNGACDVTSHDQEVAGLSLQLQQLLTAASASPSTSDNPPAGTSEPATSGDAPPAATGAGPGSSPTDTIAATLQLIQQAVQIAQSVGLVGGAGGAAGQQPGVTSPPSDAGVPPQPLIPAGPGTGQGASPSPPPPGGTPGAAPPPPPTSAGGASPVPPGPPPPTGTSPGGGSGQPGIGRPPGAIRPPGSGPQLTLIPTKPAPGQGPGSAGSAPATDATKPPSLTSKAPPVLEPPPGAMTLPGTGPIARVAPTLQRMATVRGIVRSDIGAPVKDAVIVVGGKRAATNAQGLFVVGDVPPGRQILVVTAQGFVQGKVAMDLSSGEVEQVTLTLHRALLPPSRQIPR